MPRKPFIAPWRAERILYHEAGLLVVNKPVGVPVYGGHAGLREGLVDRLADYFAERARETTALAGSGRGADEADIRGRGAPLGVHSRLDLGTSGALLFTTDPERNRDVARAFDEGTLRRRYVAVATPSKRLAAHGTVRLHLDFDGKRARPSSAGKVAITHYRIVDERGDRCLFEFELETGRTHQIRASMAHLGAPLLGDELYGGRRAPRLCLHAQLLEGAPLPRSVVAPLPSEFTELFERGELGPLNPGDVRERLLDAAAHRGPLFTSTEALRLVDGAPDFLAGVRVDVYGEFAHLLTDLELSSGAISALQAGLLELGWALSPEHERSKSEAKARERAPGVEPPSAPSEQSVLVRDAPEEDLAPSGTGEPAEFAWVREDSRSFPVALASPSGVGFPLELRELRRRLEEFPPRDSALNLFSGAGSLSRIFSSRGMRTVNVDISRAWLEQARVSLSHDGDLDLHEFRRVDARDYLRQAQRRGERFDYILVDPPARTPRAKPPLKIPDAYPGLLRGCLDCLADSGRVVFVARRALPGRASDLFAKMAEDGGYELESLHELGAGVDFRETNPLRAFVLELRRRGSSAVRRAPAPSRAPAKRR